VVSNIDWVLHDVSFIVSIRNIDLVISLCILERGNKIRYCISVRIQFQWLARWYDHVTSGRVFCNTSLGWYIVLTRNNSFEYFRNQKNKFVDSLWHREANRPSFYMWSKKNNVKWGLYIVYQWVTQDTKGSIDNARRPGRGSMMRPTRVQSRSPSLQIAGSGNEIVRSPTVYGNTIIDWVRSLNR
jgi:hypothetical protein